MWRMGGHVDHEGIVGSQCTLDKRDRGVANNGSPVVRSIWEAWIAEMGSMTVVVVSAVDVARVRASPEIFGPTFRHQ